jgi:hypothetical protein
MNDIVANCEYLREMNSNQIYNEWINDQVQDLKEKEKNSRKREEEEIMNLTIAQMDEVRKFTHEIIVPRNAQELQELISGMNYENTITEWTDKIRDIARTIGIESAQKLKYVRQVMYATDQKKTIALLTKDQTPQCEIDPEEVRKFFNERCKRVNQ